MPTVLKSVLMHHPAAAMFALVDALDALLGPVFGHVLETLVERFVARADAGAGA